MIQTPVVAFRVYGVPVPGGSKSFKGMFNGKPLLVDSGGARLKEWRRRVAEAGKTAMVGRRLMEDALWVHFHFFMPRPKYHYDRKGALKENAPILHTLAPDTTKLVRGTEDALTNVVWRDDCIIAKQECSKLYGKAGALIMVYNYEPEDALLDLEGRLLGFDSGGTARE